MMIHSYRSNLPCGDEHNGTDRHNGDVERTATRFMFVAILASLTACVQQDRMTDELARQSTILNEIHGLMRFSPPLGKGSVPLVQSSSASKYSMTAATQVGLNQQTVYIVDNVTLRMIVVKVGGRERMDVLSRRTIKHDFIDPAKAEPFDVARRQQVSASASEVLLLPVNSGGPDQFIYLIDQMSDLLFVYIFDPTLLHLKIVARLSLREAFGGDASVPKVN